MAFDGISVEGCRDAGSSLITYFAIPPAYEAAAGRELLACLSDGVEVSLRNDLDEGGEGHSSFRRSPSGLVTMVGGHRWQSQWKPIDEAGFLTAVAELACHNRGGPEAQGSIVRDCVPNPTLQRSPAATMGFHRLLRFFSGRVR